MGGQIRDSSGEIFLAPEGTPPVIIAELYAEVTACVT